MQASPTLREEEIKNTLRDQFFTAYDATPILGDVDFAVTSRRDDPAQTELFEREWFLWAEAKKGSSHSIIDSFIQLIITIGYAHTHEWLMQHGSTTETNSYNPTMVGRQITGFKRNVSFTPYFLTPTISAAVRGQTTGYPSQSKK